MMVLNRKFSLLPERMAISRLPKDASPPSWALSGPFFSVTRTEEELSVVCPQINVPEGIKRDEGWRVLKVEGPLDLSATGILVSLITPLARERISVFAVSTYDTDCLLVKEESLKKAVQVLSGEGHEIREDSSEFRVRSRKSKDSSE